MKPPLALIAVVFAFLAAAPAQAAPTRCGVRGELVRLDVRKTSCATGTAVARSWARRRSCDPPVPFLARTCAVRGWRCSATRIAVSVTRRVRCRRGHRRIAFSRGRD